MEINPSLSKKDLLFLMTIREVMDFVNAHSTPAPNDQILISPRKVRRAVKRAYAYGKQYAWHNPREKTDRDYDDTLSEQS
jgi:hypothetical protein